MNTSVSQLPATWPEEISENVDVPMCTEISSHSLTTLSFETGSGKAVYQQLYTQIRDLIISGRLVPGVRMPSSRELSVDLGVSRNTIVSTYDQLTAEGFLRSNVGVGTFVADLYANDLSRPLEITPPSRPVRSITPSSLPLTPSKADQEKFPRSAWYRAAARGQRTITPDAMFSNDSTGYRPLRQNICNYLLAMRGLQCHPDQIIITSGRLESLSIITEKVLTPNSVALIEDPSCLKTLGALKSKGVQVRPTQVDQLGMNVEEGLSQNIDCDLAWVSPTRHYPYGFQLSLQRRQTLIDWSTSTGGWIIEDDHDCDFRFFERPLDSLYSMDRNSRTIYLGSFSKSLFPQLRVGFLVAPETLLPSLTSHISQTGGFASMLAQSALSEFMIGGQFAAHLRNMRRLYKRRYEYIFEAISERLADKLDPIPVDGGMQFTALFRPCISRTTSDEDIAREAQSRGIGVKALSPCLCDTHSPQQGLIIGFASTHLNQADKAISGLAELIYEFQYG
jgi:GntR family transcriptional regulator/MocR family aminotransferase